MLGSALTAQSLESALDSVSLSLPQSLSLKNKQTLKKEKAIAEI